MAVGQIMRFLELGILLLKRLSTSIAEVLGHERKIDLYIQLSMLTVGSSQTPTGVFNASYLVGFLVGVFLDRV
jgi:hypothetical protein